MRGGGLSGRGIGHSRWYAPAAIKMLAPLLDACPLRVPDLRFDSPPAGVNSPRHAVFSAAPVGGRRPLAGG
eukprot:2394665-Pyramimonas_sp.AAC.1